ncbi:MAG: transglycosylase domain-containing protein, partial [Myxococcota bacterium]|nr:transglycosylase domain-containing protein [Myxococcota bacterium]
TFNPTALTVRVLKLEAEGVRLHLQRRGDGSDNMRGPLLGVLKLAGWGPRDKTGLGGGGLSRYVDKHLPDVKVSDLEITADTATPVAPGMPTHASFARGHLTASNTALLKEEDNITVKLHFGATSLSPRGGLDVEVAAPLKGKKLKAKVSFQRPVEVPLGERLLSLRSLSWDAGVLSVEGVEISRPNITAIADAEPQIAVEKIRVDVSLDDVIATVGQVLAGGEVGQRDLLGALNRVVIERPTLVFERGLKGHSLQDLIPDGVAVEDEPQTLPTERALGHLMEATNQAIRRLAIREEEAGGGFRGFMVRGFDRLETAVARGSQMVAQGVVRFPFRRLSVQGGHFTWRDATLSDPGRADLEGRLENFDLTVVQEEGAIRFEGAFMAPGTTRQANRVEGRVHLTSGDVEVRATIDRLRLHPYRHVLPKSLTFDDATSLSETDLSWVWSPTTRVARMEGKLSLSDGAFFYRGLSSVPLTGIEARLDFVSEIDTAKKKVVLQKSQLKLGNVEMTVDGVVENYADIPQVSGNIEMPRARCQDVVDAIPAEFIPLLEGLKVRGTVGWNLTFKLDTGDMDSLKYDLSPQLTHFKVVDMGNRLNLEAVSGTFLHRIEEEDGTVREIIMGRDAPTWASIEEINDYVVQAVTTTEDGSFYKHKGWSAFAIRQSLVTNLKKGSFVRGASTISQQLVKNLFLSREKTISRKFQELFITAQLEGALDKDRIMELYLNVIEFGPGIYGLGPASLHYFGKEPLDLTALEAVFLVSLIPSPKRYYHQYERGEVDDAWRRHLRWIMKVMVQRGKLSEDEFLMAAPYSPEFYRPQDEFFPEEEQEPLEEGVQDDAVPDGDQVEPTADLPD